MFAMPLILFIKKTSQMIKAMTHKKFGMLAALTVIKSTIAKRPLHLITAFALLFHTNFTLANTLSASVDRTAISENETVNLTVSYNGDRVNSDPDFSGLTQHFDLLQNQKSMQHSVANGRVSSSTDWHITLLPKQTGQLLIPPFTLKGQTSKPITISVKESAIDPSSGKDDVFLETRVSQEQSYVQEQILITFALHYNRRVDQLDMPDLAINNGRIESLPRVDYQKQVGQTTYGVSEFRFALFPDTSGTINIPSQLWTVRTNDMAGGGRFGFGGGRYKLHRVKTQKISLDVLPKPDDFPANGYWLPAQEVKIQQSWSQDTTEFKLGEPITRTVTITAQGASGEQLPNIFSDPNPNDFKFYPDKPKQESQVTENGVVGTRVESVAIVPNRTGTLVLPEISIPWWNSKKKQVEIAKLPAVTIEITEASGATQSTQPVFNPAASIPSKTDLQPQLNPQANPTSWVWPSICLLLLLSNGYCIYLLKTSRSKNTSTNSQVPNSSEPLKGIISSCQSKDATGLQKQLLLWVSEELPGRPSSLKTLALFAQDDEFAQHLRKLDEKLYKDSNIELDYQTISSKMKSLDKQQRHVQNENSLIDFYPT